MGTHLVDMELGVVMSFFVYLSYLVLIASGHVNDFLDRLLRRRTHREHKGYAMLMSDFEAFYTRRLYSRIQDCWNRPIKGVPGAWVDVIKRESSDETWKTDLHTTGDTVRCLNLASYNYLGFAQNWGPIFESVLECTRKYGVSTTSPSVKLGKTELHRECEVQIAQFLGKSDAIVFGMGYEANSTTIPALVRPGDLIISDSKNHASVVYGCRLSGASVKVFKHNDPEDLEHVVREAICRGHPRLRRAWRRILIIVEGIYSMEGEICNLPEIVRIKKQYHCYLFIDEAHSIGALGDTARGICEYHHVSPQDVDILMGTFTKSFGSIGGYIAADKPIIDYLRFNAFSSVYETSLSPGSIQQILGVLACIRGEDDSIQNSNSNRREKNGRLNGRDEKGEARDLSATVDSVRRGAHDSDSVGAIFQTGKERRSNLKKNIAYVRSEFQMRGFRVLGSPDSPVVPLMLYFPGKLPAISRACLQRGIAVVVVGFPATQLLECRVRLCLSATHTRKELAWAIDVIDQIGDEICIKYGKVGGEEDVKPKLPKLSISLVDRVE